MGRGKKDSQIHKYINPTRGWNFRIVRHVQPDGSPYYGIHEAYYSERGMSITEDPIRVGSEEPQGIDWQLREMYKALTRPVIDSLTLKHVSERAAVFEMAHPTPSNFNA